MALVLIFSVCIHGRSAFAEKFVHVRWNDGYVKTRDMQDSGIDMVLEHSKEPFFETLDTGLLLFVDYPGRNRRILSNATVSTIIKIGFDI
jgi:hypothetical protein